MVLSTKTILEYVWCSNDYGNTLIAEIVGSRNRVNDKFQPKTDQMMRGLNQYRDRTDMVLQERWSVGPTRSTHVQDRKDLLGHRLQVLPSQIQSAYRRGVAILPFAWSSVLSIAERSQQDQPGTLKKRSVGWWGFQCAE